MSKTIESAPQPEQATDFRHDLAAQADALNSGYVPTRQELDSLQKTASELNVISNGSVQSPEGFVNKGQAMTVIEAADPKNWMLDHSGLIRNEKLARASHFSEVKDIVKRDTSMPAYEQLRRLKTEAQARLELNAELRDEQRSSAMQKGAELRRKREDILTKKMSDELGSTEKQTFETVLEEEKSKIEERLKETSQDKVNQHYARKEFEQDAKRAAREASKAAVQERKAKIEAHGGAAAISHLKAQEAEESKKADFRQRVLGKYDVEQTADTAKKQPEWTSRQYNPAVHGSYKNYLESGGARKAETIKQTVAAKDAENVVDESATEQLVAEKAEDISRKIRPISAEEPKEKLEGVLGTELGKNPLAHDKLDMILGAIAGGRDLDRRLVRSLENELNSMAAALDDADKQAFYSELNKMIGEAYQTRRGEHGEPASNVSEGLFGSEDELHSEVHKAQEEIMDEVNETGGRRRFAAVLSSARKRINNLTSRGYMATQGVISGVFERASVYFSDEEKGRQRKIQVAAAAVVIGAGAIYLGTKYGIDLPGGKRANTGLADGVKDQIPTPSGTNASSIDTLADSATSAQPSGGSGETTQHITESLLPRVPGQRADTISDHALQHLIRNGNTSPTQQQIVDETSRILQLNNLTLEQARELPVGFEFKI